MQTTARQQLAIHKGQALALCWLLQQPVGSGGEVLVGLTRTLAFSRPLSGTEWAALPVLDRERETRAFHQRVLRLFRKGIAIRCPVVAKVSPTARGLKVERFRDAKTQDQGLLQLLEARGDRLRRCRHCGRGFGGSANESTAGPASSRAQLAVRSTERRRPRQQAGGSPGLLRFDGQDPTERWKRRLQCDQFPLGTCWPAPPWT